jgi:hypothetical protein
MTQTSDRYTYETISADQLTATDLRMESQSHTNLPIECARVTIDNQAEKAQVLYFPDFERGGIAWGADSQWTDASSLEDVIDRYLEDRLAN